MPKEFSRDRRVAGLIKKELAVLIQRQTSGSDLGMVTISAVDLSRDLQNAKIFVTCLASKKSNAEVIQALNESAPQYRHDLSKAIISRTVPHLVFVFDESIERGQHMSSLIDSLATDDKKETED